MAPLSRSPSSSKLPYLQHFTHPKHPLHLLNIPQEFLCNGCNELGFGLRYHCAMCDFDLHDICATCPATTPSPLHPNHPLTLVNQPVNDRFCDLCGDLVHGLFYTCRACDFDVHPLCAQLPLHVQLPLHHHFLKLQPEGLAGCALCFKGCTSWRYRCDACCLDIHLECVIGGGAPDHASKTTAAPVMCKAVFRPPMPQQVGFAAGCAVGIPVGGGGCGGYGMPSPVMMNQPLPSEAEGQKRSGKTRKKIYTVVARLAATAVVTSLIGLPFGI